MGASSMAKKDADRRVTEWLAAIRLHEGGATTTAAAAAAAAAATSAAASAAASGRSMTPKKNKKKKKKKKKEKKKKEKKKTVKFDMDANVTRLYVPHGLEPDGFPEPTDQEKVDSLLRYRKAALETYKMAQRPKGTAWVSRVGKVEYEALAREERKELELEAAAVEDGGN